jgi:hypothetical protein
VEREREPGHDLLAWKGGLLRGASTKATCFEQVEWPVSNEARGWRKDDREGGREGEGGVPDGIFLSWGTGQVELFRGEGWAGAAVLGPG